MKSGVLDLADGRQLEYGSFGPPDAPPVMYCHGFPTSRLELELIEPALTQSGLDVQVVALNRPGYGYSSFQPRRTLLDWPRDVVEAADLLELGEFAVLGVSGGSPYALACALAVPDRVSQLGIAVGIGPAEADGMDNSLAFRTVSKSAMIRRFQFGMIALGLNRGQEEKVLEKSLANFSEPDLSVLERPEMQDWFIRVMKESFKQGGRGAAHDASLYLNDWASTPATSTLRHTFGMAAPTAWCLTVWASGWPTGFGIPPTRVGPSTAISRGWRPKPSVLWNRSPAHNALFCCIRGWFGEG